MGLAVSRAGKYSVIMFGKLNPVSPFLDQQGFVMLDGGLATEMESRGADLDDDLWSAKMLIEAPELIRQVHYDYLVSGADIIATASYQASFNGLREAGYDQRQAASLMRLSMELGVEAREKFWSERDHRRGRLRPLVAASVGPYGACLHNGSEYHGNYGVGRQELIDFHGPRIELFADSEADIFAFETIPSQLEAEVLLELLGEFPRKFAWLSFSCKDSGHVCHGERFTDCLRMAEGCEQLLAVGINCTAPEHLTGLLESAGPTDQNLAVYPNSGEVWRAEDNQWVGGVNRGFEILEWYARGARIFGGCCRTGMEDIHTMRAILERHVEGLQS
jgi:homocysteine S-methyltransferase